jgi:hypothetical protein
MTNHASMTFGGAAMGLAAAILIGPAPALAQDDVVHEKHQVFVHALADVDDAEARTVEVMIEDGEMTVVVNGEKIPVDRIKRKDGRVIILDENGAEMENVFVFAGGEELPVVIGGGEGIGVGDSGFWLDLRGKSNDFSLLHPAGEEPKVMIGVAMSEPGGAPVKHLRLEPGTTTLITGVYEGLPAQVAGMEEHDIITEINGRTPANPKAIKDAIDEMEAGDTVRLTVIRAGERTRATVTLAEYDAEVMHAATLLGRRGGAAGPGGFRVERFFGDADKPFGKNAWREIIVSPDHNSVFEIPHIRMPDTDVIQRQLRDRLERSFRLRLDGEEHGEEEIESRLDDLNDLMEELEDALSDVMRKIEEEDGE